MANPERERINYAEEEIRQWWSEERWSHTKRDYTPKDVAVLRGTLKVEYPSNHTAKKLYNMMRYMHENKKYTATYGALDPVQVVNEAKYLDTIYVSGWQCSSTASTSFHRGPDFADYPANTVPNKVGQLFEALMFQDRIQAEERARMSDAELKKTPKYDFLTPIIADADCGFGGITSTMKLAKMFAENGAAGIHIEDQKAGVKKCGHMGGKVIVSMREWMERIQSARLQFDIMGTDTVIVARTDTFSGKFIESTHDWRDQPYILGAVDPNNTSKMMTYPDAGIEAIKKQLPKSKQAKAIAEWNKHIYGLPLVEARKLASKLGFSFYFDWESVRSAEGFYPLKHGMDFAVARVRAMAPYCDAIWMETPTPDLKDCQLLSDRVKAINPKIMLAYNLSPSFNWELYDKEYIRTFCDKIGEMGYVWQFITLAGFHMNGLISELFSRAFKKDKAHAFVEMIQSQERRHNVDQLKHQKWSGAQLVDKEITIVTNGSSSIKSMGEGCTEDQFEKPVHNIKARL